MAWVTYGSPLWHKDKVPDHIHPLPDIHQRKEYEARFVNDAIRTQVFHYPRKKPIIPPYDAVKDKYARAYFQSPLVKAILHRTSLMQEMKARQQLNTDRSLNKLSTRRICKKTPSLEDIRAREHKFVNDAILTERNRTKYRDIIPQYDATFDKHCTAYFKRKDVQKLVSVTCSRHTNWSYDPKGKYYVILLTADDYIGSKMADDNKGQTTDDKKKTKTASPRGRHNKLYRCPPTPAPEKLLEKEKSFVLDCTAVSSISCDFSKANPKLGPVIPPYNAQKDMHVSNYFKFHGVDKTLKKTDQVNPGTSIDGAVMDYFEERGPGAQYLTLRNDSGAGHSRDLVDGHAQFMQGVRPVIGYNGAYGFRRNTPWLRHSPSPFGTASRSPTHQSNVQPRQAAVQAK